MKTERSRRTGQRFPARIASEEWYLWDNFGYVENEKTHIYAQAADKNRCDTIEDRYWRAYWRHFSSEDGGKSWRDEGPALWPQEDPRAYDSYNIWSGSVLVREDGRKMAAYTGLVEGKLALQSIAIAVSEDGFHFERVCGNRPLLSAELDYEALTAKGYYLGPEETVGNIEEEADGIFLCLRDPFLFQDDDTRIHIFFGAKAVIDNEVVRVVGHAVFRDPDQLREIELLPPIVVPDGDQFNQLELPNVLKQNDIYYLIVSTTNLAYIGQSDLEAEKTVRIYRSEHLDRGWQCYGDDGKHIVLPPEAELYGLHILSDPSREAGTLTCRAFRVGKAYLPPSLRLRVGGPYPELMFPDELWKMDSGFIRQYE